MSIATDIASILTKLENWEEHGFPSCGIHTEKIKQLEKDMEKHTVALWGGLVTALLGCFSLIGMLIWG
jgi:hypothetical protein